MNRLLLFLLVFSLIISECLAQASPLFIPPPGRQLNIGWKWHAGDNADWARPTLDDSQWESINPTQDIMDIPQLWRTNIGWFRLRFTLDSVMTAKSLALLVEQTGASEIYLNGQLLGRFGTINEKTGKVNAVSPAIGTFLGCPVRKAGEQVLAVRFAIQKKVPYIEAVGQPNRALFLLLTDSTNINFFRQNDIRAPLDYSKFGIYLLLSIIHVALFYFDTSQKSNLYFFLSTFSITINSLLQALVYYYIQDAFLKMGVLISTGLTYVLGCIFLLLALYTIFNHRRGFIIWFLIVYSVISILALFVHYHASFNLGISLLGFLTFLESIRIMLLSVRRRQKGARIMVWGSAFFLLFYTLWGLILFKYLPGGPAWIYGHLAYNLGLLSLPVSISLFLALEASFNSRSLAEKLVEVQQLSVEKQQILASQNETLEQQVNERTLELKQSLLDLKTTQNQLIQKEKLASLGELTAGIAHEIQNPLNFVNNFAEVAVELTEELDQSVDENDPSLTKELSSDLRQNMRQIAHNGQRAASIVRAMLEHSQSSTGERQPIQLNTLAEEYLRLAYHGFRAKDSLFIAILHTDFQADLPLLDGVIQDLSRVLLNLYNNAFYALKQRQLQENQHRQGATPYEPTLCVSTRLVRGLGTGQLIELRVKDNGLGIPAKIQAKVFQPFFTTKPTGQGTGLGLSLSYDIITKGHGGEMWVESQEGLGTMFFISLPIHL